MSLTTEYHATHRFARISVQKVRPLLDLIQGHYADDALDVLKYMPQRGARMVETEPSSKRVMANAEDKGIRNVSELIVMDARENGRYFKRLMPRGTGHGIPDPPPYRPYRHRAVRPGNGPENR